MSSAAGKKALVILAPGAEEMETVISVDVLRRGGIQVILAGLNGASPVTCSRQVVLVPDTSLSDPSITSAQSFDAVVLPGGLEGAHAMADSPLVKSLLQKQEAAGKIIAAICAAPIALKTHQIGKGKNVTSHPCKAEDLKACDFLTYKEDRVVVDGNVVTSRGPGTAFEFALQLVRMLVSDQKAREIAKGMLVKEQDIPTL